MPPAQLNDEVAELSKAFGTLNTRLDRDSLEAFGNQVLELRRLLKEVLNALDVFKDDGSLSGPKLKIWETLNTNGKLQRLKKVGEGLVIEESTELSTFFKNISNSVIEAQKQLNQLSEDYVEELEHTKSPVPPTFFAIPSLKAEMKLGVSEMTSKGINVLIFKNEQQKDRFFESSVTFEVVSTPPAPATRPRPIESPLSPLSGPPIQPAIQPLALESVTPAAAIESSQLDELTLELEEARAAMVAVTETLTEAKPLEKPKPKKRLVDKILPSRTKKAAKKSAARKTRKSKR